MFLPLAVYWLISISVVIIFTRSVGQFPLFRDDPVGSLKDYGLSEVIDTVRKLKKIFFS